MLYVDKKIIILFFIFSRDTWQVSWGNNKIKIRDVLKNETLIPPFCERKIRLFSTSLRHVSLSCLLALPYKPKILC
jgi:hypothetical protein